MLEHDFEVKCAADLDDEGSGRCDTDHRNMMYETEERMIEQVERLAAELPVNVVRKGMSATDAATINAIRCAISSRESALSSLLPIYQELTRRPVADPTCKQLLQRAWAALLSVERDKDSLLYDLHKLQAEAGNPQKH